MYFAQCSLGAGAMLQQLFPGPMCLCVCVCVSSGIASATAIGIAIAIAMAMATARLCNCLTRRLLTLHTAPAPW